MQTFQQIIDKINNGQLVLDGTNYVTFDVSGFTVFHAVLKAEEVPPQIIGASLGSSSGILFLSFSEPVQGHSGLTLNASGGPVSLTYDSGEGTSNMVFLLSRSVIGETVTLDHSGTGIQDLVGNELPSVSGFAVS